MRDFFHEAMLSMYERYLTGNVGKINAGDNQKIGAEKAATVTQRVCVFVVFGEN